jgi:hypothetical protein
LIAVIPLKKYKSPTWIAVEFLMSNFSRAADAEAEE